MRAVIDFILIWFTFSVIPPVIVILYFSTQDDFEKMSKKSVETRNEDCNELIINKRLMLLESRMDNVE
jgi:hypothetical protein